MQPFEGHEAFLAGLLIKIIDDTIDDGIWWEPCLWPATAVACWLALREMLESQGKAVMMTAFTIACCETKGIDNVFFAVATSGVFVTALYQLGDTSFTTDFHQQMCLLGTTYAGILATRLDSYIDNSFGFNAKTVFRILLGLTVTQARPFVPVPYQPQHDFLVSFISGYGAGVLLSIPQLYWRRRG
eukprot:TRINITY_DN38439_c0_g1_i1.p1 TRINITY_DN38439_c0_g1~~TRINITY_DN38439_c0_g1_i1.p1  ORF type:complete len:204 (+),score=36.55 TRINITY_DN38439_c0_g1_i1:56-613(+)